MQLVDDQKQESGERVPGRRPEATASRLAFIAHPSRKIVLRPVGPVPASLPRELLPGDRLGELGFAELATAFRGVAQIDPATGRAVIVEAAAAAPQRLAFRVGGNGGVALRALDGERWADEVAPGRPVFGLEPDALRRARQGVLILDAATLTASLEGQPEHAGAPPEHPLAIPPPRRRWRVKAAAAALAAAGLGAAAAWWGLDGPVPQEPAVSAPPPGNAVERLEALAAAVTDPVLRAELAAIATAVRQERLAREREHGQAAASAIKAGAQLARAYRRDEADVRRLETALGVCGGDQACRAQYEPALARATATRELTRDAYVELIRQVADAYPQALLENRLITVEAQHGELDEAGGVPDLARRFVAQVARWRGGTDADRETIARELLGS